MLALDDTTVVIGDPLAGRFTVDRADLLERLRWTGAAIVVLDDGRRLPPPRLQREPEQAWRRAARAIRLFFHRRAL